MIIYILLLLIIGLFYLIKKENYINNILSNNYKSKILTGECGNCNFYSVDHDRVNMYDNKPLRKYCHWRLLTPV